MKKTIAFCACLLMGAAVLTACGEGGSDAAPADGFTPPEVVEQASDGIGAMAHSTEFADLAEFHPSGTLEMLQVDSQVDGYASQEGYYRMVPGTDGSVNLRYIDFATRQEVYLCSQPNCTHDSDSCTAWFPTFRILYHPVPVGNKLVLVCSGNIDYKDLLGQDAVPSIEIMNLNGTERKRVFTFPASTMISTYTLDAMARDDENVYFCLQTFTEEGAARALCAVSSRTGKVFRLAELTGADEKIVGCDGTALILGHMPVAYDIGMAAGEVKSVVERFDVQTLAATQLFEHFYVDVGECRDGQFWLMCKDGVLRSYDLQDGNLTSEKQIDLPAAFDPSKLHSDGLFEGKLMVHGHAANATDGPSQLFYYAIDVNTGEATPLEHQYPDEGGTNYPGIVAAQTGDTFLFAYNAAPKTVDYLFPDGSTMAYDYPVYEYAFQPAADYWNNSQEYTVVPDVLE